MGNKTSKSVRTWIERDGSFVKNNVACEYLESLHCLICWEPISNIHARCVGCNIRLHSVCEKRYRETEERKYCLCPHCKKVGTLALSLTKEPK